MEEVFRPIPGFEGVYEVSSHGRVKSLVREIDSAGGSTRLNKKKIRKLSLDTWGYPKVSLKNARAGKHIPSIAVHRLVAVAFIPNPDSKPHVNHIDGDKANNKVGNLEWVTNAENMKHAVALGLVRYDNRIRLTVEQVYKIRTECKSGKTTHRALAEKYGVGLGAISNISTRRTWKNLPDLTEKTDADL